ncbi:MAG: hypothetical protein ACK5MT_06085 [Actinomycetales bacterium]
MKHLLEILVIDDCPHAGPSRELAVAALDALGIAGDPVQRTIRSRESATENHFMGSPSFHWDGLDLFPVDGAPGLACRVYPRADGRLAGLPTLRALIAAIQIRR